MASKMAEADYRYLLVTEFEGLAASYEPGFPSSKGINYSTTDRENEVSKIFVTSLLYV